MSLRSSGTLKKSTKSIVSVLFYALFCNYINPSVPYLIDPDKQLNPQCSPIRFTLYRMLTLRLKSHLFEGSKRLLEIADVIEEVPTVCWCGRRAHYNTCIKDGQVVRTGEQIMLGGNEKYVSLCRNLLGCQKYLSRLKDLDAPAIIRLLYNKDVCKCSSCGGTEKRVTLTRSAVSGGS